MLGCQNCKIILRNNNFRVNYDENNWKKIATTLLRNHTSIHRTNRAQIIDDSFNLARAGHLNYSIAFSLTKYLTQELDFIPWSSAINALDYINTMLENCTTGSNTVFQVTIVIFRRLFGKARPFFFNFGIKKMLLFFATVTIKIGWEIYLRSS